MEISIQYAKPQLEDSRPRRLLTGIVTNLLVTACAILLIAEAKHSKVEILKRSQGDLLNDGCRDDRDDQQNECCKEQDCQRCRGPQHCAIVKCAAAAAAGGAVLESFRASAFVTRRRAVLEVRLLCVWVCDE